MVTKVKTLLQNTMLWVKYNFAFLLTLAFAIALGILFIVYPHMFDWLNNMCDYPNSCQTGGIS